MPKNNFLRELKRRNVYRVALTYAVVAWLLAQVVSLASSTFNAPGWVMQMIFVILIIGFPIALILAWAFELSPQGVIRTTSAAAIENPYPDTKKKPLTSNIFIGILLLALVGQYAYFKFSDNLNNAPEVVPEEIRSEAVAVVPFENLTNDAALDNMGKIAANFINMGLMELEDAVVISPSTVLSSMNAFGILPNDPSGRMSFSELTGARNTLTGHYYMENGSIIFALQVQDATTGQVRFAFPLISGDVGTKEEMLTQLREKVMGYWVARALIDTRRIKSPNYTAYEMFLGLIGKWPDPVVLDRILSLDSTFYLPRIMFININRGAFIPGVNEKHFQFLDRHFDHLSSYEKSWLSFLKHLYMGNSIEAFNTIHAIRLKYPKDFLVNHESAVTAREMLNNPELAFEIYQELDMDLFTTSQVGLYYYLRVLNEIIIIYKLKGREAIVEKAASFIDQEDDNGNLAHLVRINLAMHGRNKDEFRKAVKDYCTNESNLMNLEYFLRLFFNSTECTEDMRAIIVEQTEIRLDLAESRDPGYVTLRAWINTNKKIPLDDHFDYKVYKPDLRQLTYIDLLKTYCLSKIRSGNMDAISEAMEELAELDKPDYGISSLYGCGRAQYNLGVIYAALGEKEIAVRYLRKARHLGVPVWLSNFKYDMEVSNLRGMPEFEALHQPILPKILD